MDLGRDLRDASRKLRDDRKRPVVDIDDSPPRSPSPLPYGLESTLLPGPAGPLALSLMHDFISDADLKAIRQEPDNPT